MGVDCVSDDLGDHEEHCRIFQVNDKISDLWLCAEFIERFHLLSCVIGVHDTCKPNTDLQPPRVLDDKALVITCLWAWWMPVTMMILFGSELR